MTKAQLKELENLEDQAITTYLDKTNFSIIDWLDIPDQKKYCELYNMQFDEKDFLCETHKNWQ